LIPRDRGLAFLGELELALLLKARAGVALTRGLELGPVRAQLLRETALRRNWDGPSGLLVLRAGRRRGGNLTPLECLVEAVELRKDEVAGAVVLGACELRLRVCARVGSSAASSAGQRRGLCCCRPIGAVDVIGPSCRRFSVRGGGGIPEVDGCWKLLPGSQTCRAGRAKVPRKATNLALVVNDAACLVMVLLGTPKPPSSCDSCMRMSTHKVLLVPRRVGGAGALFQEGVGDLVVDVLLLNHVVVGELCMAVQILQPGRLAKPYGLVVDEAILDVLEFVDVLHNCLTIILYKVLDKSISADGNTKTNVAVNYKGRGGEQGTEVREGGVGGKQVLSCIVRISAEIPLTRSLVFLKLRSRPASSLNTCLISERTSKATLSFALMPSSAMH
jgi:hypothetical protein